MTVTADDRRCVILPTAQPGESFNLQLIDGGKILLTPLESQPVPTAKVTVLKENGYTVGLLDRPINEQALKEALVAFP
jgi:hypothetical protein